MKSSKMSGKRISNFDVYPKNAVAKTIMYQNMSSHYRRIYNAKPRIDTGPPFSHKPKSTTQWNKKQKEYCIMRTSQSSLSTSPTKTCSRQGCGDRATPSFQPQISQTSSESKLRTLRVYHPPRKRIFSTSPSSIEMKSDPEISVPEIPWIRSTEEVKTTSKGSSSDSAYTEEGEGGWSGGESRGPTPISDTQRMSRSEDLLYVKFIGGITEEVLRKGIFTNKALKNIFQSHIDAHKQYLNLRRMQEEVEKLQSELGIPKDDKPNSPQYISSYESIPEESMKVPRSKVEDKELMDALSQLNLSPSLRADVAMSLGLFSSLESMSNSSSSESIKVRNHSKRTTFSSPLEVIHDVSRKSDKLPLSDDDSYEILSEGSESRPLTPLGLSW
uniref:Uncharacterized protein n=1 Tax=Graphocephala atropunctata TaxID=36148 RepID=A0A1B6KQH2_9HEMI